MITQILPTVLVGPVAPVMTEDELAPAELRSLLGFACGLGLDEATVRKIYEAVGREATATGARA